MGGVIHPLHQVDLLTPAERKITEKEYWAQRRGQEKLDELNQKMKEDGITPKETRYQTEKQFLRDAIDDAGRIFPGSQQQGTAVQYFQAVYYHGCLFLCGRFSGKPADGYAGTGNTQSGREDPAGQR